MRGKNQIYLIIILVVVLVAGAISGVYYYDTVEDAFLSGTMQGNFTYAPVLFPITIGVWFGFNHILYYLYSIAGFFDWYAFFMLLGYIFLIVQVVLLLSDVWPGIKRLIGGQMAYVVGAGCLLLFADIFVLWQFTKLSLLLAGTSIYGTWVSSGNPAQYSKTQLRLREAFNTFCFVYAACIRIETVIVSLVIGMPLFYLAYTQKYPLKKYFSLLIPVLTIVVLSLVVNKPTNAVEKSYLDIRRYQFALFDFKQSPATMQLNTPSDSIKFIAAVKAFWIDSEQINTAFFNKIGLLPMDKTPSAAPYYLRNLKPGLHKLIKAGRNIWAEYPGLVWAYFFFLFSGLWLIYRHNRAVFISSLFAQTWGIMLFTGITVLMKMETWVLAPMIWCAIMVNAIWCIKVLSGNGLVKSKALSLSIGAGVMLSAVLLGGTVDFMKWKSYRHELHTMDEIRQAVNKLPQHNVLASLSFMIRLHTQPFQPKPLYNKSLICLDNWFLFLYPEFNTFMDREFGTAQPVKAMQALLAKRDDVVFVSTIDRADMMSRYFNTVHNMALNFSGVPGLGPYYLGKKVDGRTVFIYRIE